MEFHLEISMFSTQQLSWRVVGLHMTPPVQAFVINLKKENPVLPSGSISILLKSIGLMKNSIVDRKYSKNMLN